MKIDGLKVFNVRKSLIIKVLPIDIKASKSKEADKCAAAIACKRQFKAVDARVHVGRTYLRFNGKWMRYHTSPALRSEIVSFDRGGKFSQGEYTLYGIQPSKLTGRQQGGKNHKPKKYKKHSHIYHILSGVRPSLRP